MQKPPHAMTCRQEKLTTHTATMFRKYIPYDCVFENKHVSNKTERRQWTNQK